MRGLVTEALRRDGYQVDDFADGADLSSEVSEPSTSPFDLIVSDVHMPYVTGLAVLRALRESSSNLPFVLMTAYGDDRLRREVSDLGAVLFNKPFEIAELRDVVRGLLERRASLSSAEQTDAKLGR
jgi:DNA-binding response OmpR family regulator